MPAASDRLIAAWCVLLAACSSAEIVPIDASGGGTDAGSADGGAADASGTDAGGRDGGGVDAGTTGTDGGTDAGPSETPGPGDVVITEIMPDSDVVTDDCGEWFELHNPSSTATYNLRGCALHDTANVAIVSVDLRIGPGETVSLARWSRDPCETSLGIADPGFTFDYSYGPTVKFSNTGDQVWVSCPGGEVDRVSFATWTIQKGLSFNLDPGSFDTTANDDQVHWCSGTTPYNSGGGEVDRGTPGDPNDDC